MAGGASRTALRARCTGDVGALGKYSIFEGGMTLKNLDIFFPQKMPDSSGLKKWLM